MCCRAGSLNAAKCEELGVHGRYRALLKEGETITTRSGLTVRPEEVRAPLCIIGMDVQAVTHI